MKQLKVCLRSVVILGMTLLLMGSFPVSTSLAASGDTSSSSAPTSSSTTSGPTTGPQTQTGPTQPTGPDASTYTYNPTTGLWENAYYIWNPTTGQTTPITPQTYSYNPATGMWDTTQWVYDPTSSSYVPNVQSVQQPPAGAPTVGSPDTISNSGPSSNNTVTNSPNNNTTFDNFFNGQISNNLSSNAQSGNASVSGNTTAGNATTGNADALATLINSLQSSSGLTSGNLTTFTDNINGDVNGNLLIDPNALTAQNGSLASNIDNLQFNTQNNGQINNNLNLAATSGDAAVTNNTTGGNATSGSANAAADVVNMINSIIAAKQSFLGLINIYGNLNGNIVVPQDFINSLLADNGQNSVTVPNGQTTTTINQLNNQSINNQITTTAASGAANVSNNTTAGNASSGNANTNVTILNLTGQQVIGKNSLLVFVNVMGTWVGLIMDAPAGTTAAELGGGITQNSGLPATNTTINNTNNDQINNNINVAANSGSATVSQNTTAGNASSGNATAGVSLSNFIGSQLDLSNWFGILFINVFGSWHGNFGIATPTADSSTSTTESTTNNTPQVFNFIASNDGSYHITPLSSSGSQSNSENPPIIQAKAVLPNIVSETSSKPTAKVVHKFSLGSMLLIALGSVGLIIIIGERIVSLRRSRSPKLN